MLLYNCYSPLCWGPRSSLSVQRYFHLRKAGCLQLHFRYIHDSKNRNCKWLFCHALIWVLYESCSQGVTVVVTQTTAEPGDYCSVLMWLWPIFTLSLNQMLLQFQTANELLPLQSSSISHLAWTAWGEHEDGEGPPVKFWYLSFWCSTNLSLSQLATEHDLSCTWNSFQPFQSITTFEAIISTRNYLKAFTNKSKLTNLEFAQWPKRQSFFPCTLICALQGLCPSALRSLYFLSGLQSVQMVNGITILHYWCP